MVFKIRIMAIENHKHPLILAFRLYIASGKKKGRSNTSPGGNQTGSDLLLGGSWNRYQTCRLYYAGLQKRQSLSQANVIYPSPRCTVISCHEIPGRVTATNRRAQWYFLGIFVFSQSGDHAY
jgi:hypothetical protein